MNAGFLKSLVGLFKSAYKGFSDDKVPKLGGSLAYFTLFSLGPMLLVVIFFAGIFLGKQMIEGSLNTQMTQLIGAEAAQQLQQIIKSASTSKGSGVAALVGIVTLLLGATSVFTEIQDSINTIWRLKLKPKQGMMRLLKSRLLAFGIIGGIGFLLLVSLIASAFVEGLGENLEKLIPGIGIRVFYWINQALTLAVASLLFALIFKVLPAARIRWRDVWPGALLTALLFILGRFAISFYISKSDFGNTYGAAGSLVVLLVWIYYSSLILYFGAEFTKAYSNKFGAGIRPRGYAEQITE